MTNENTPKAVYSVRTMDQRQQFTQCLACLLKWSATNSLYTSSFHPQNNETYLNLSLLSFFEQSLIYI